MKKVDVVEIFGVEVYASLSSSISSNAEIDCIESIEIVKGDNKKYGLLIRLGIDRCSYNGVYDYREVVDKHFTFVDKYQDIEVLKAGAQVISEAIADYLLQNSEIPIFMVYKDIEPMLFDNTIGLFETKDYEPTKVITIMDYEPYYNVIHDYDYNENVVKRIADMPSEEVEKVLEEISNKDELIKLKQWLNDYI